MSLLYLLRSPGTGHSIEGVFASISAEMQRNELPVSLVRLPYISRGIRSVCRNLRCVKALTGHLVHITGDVQYAALALPASRTVLTIHDCYLLEINRSRPFRYAFFWLFWYYLPVRKAGRVTAVSEKTRQELIQRLGPVARRVRVIPNGYDPLFTFSDKPFNRSNPVLLQLGTAAHKNVSALLKAIEGIACTLVLVGSLSVALRAELQQRHIRYRHYENLSRAEIHQLYTDSDIVTFLSGYEGFGMPVLEANAIGRAVITAPWSPMREVAAGAAHLADPADITAIRQGILRLIQDDDYRRSLIDKGVWNARRFTAAQAAGAYRKIYDELGFSHQLTALHL